MRILSTLLLISLLAIELSTSLAPTTTTKARLLSINAYTHSMQTTDNNLKTLVFKKLDEYARDCCSTYYSVEKIGNLKGKDCDDNAHTQMAYYASIPKQVSKLVSKVDGKTFEKKIPKLNKVEQILAYLDENFNPSHRSINSNVKARMCGHVKVPNSEFPYFALPEERSNAAGFIHAEQKLLPLINGISKGKEHINFYLYTYNSPCTNGVGSCTDTIFDTVYEWKERKNNFHVGFSKWFIWNSRSDGTTGPTPREARSYFCFGKYGQTRNGYGVDGNKWERQKIKDKDYEHKLTFTKIRVEDKYWDYTKKKYVAFDDATFLMGNAGIAKEGTQLQKPWYHC